MTESVSEISRALLVQQIVYIVYTDALSLEHPGDRLPYRTAIIDPHKGNDAADASKWAGYDVVWRGLWS